MVQAEQKLENDAPIKCRLRSVSSISTSCTTISGTPLTVKVLSTSCSSATVHRTKPPVVVSTPCSSSTLTTATTGHVTTTLSVTRTTIAISAPQSKTSLVSTPCTTCQNLSSSTIRQTSTRFQVQSTSSPLTSRFTSTSSTQKCSSCTSSRSQTRSMTSSTTSSILTTTAIPSRSSTMSSTVTTTATSSKYSTPTPGPPPPSERPPSPTPPGPPPPSERPPSNRPPSEPPSPPTRPPPPPPAPETPPPTDGSEPPTASPPPSPRPPPPSGTPKPPSKKPPIIKRNRKGGKGGTKGDSPLVFDVNKDGVVSASKNIGISKDPSNPNNQDGGAVGGDKMLAMSDLNGNGVVDIQEVFGDHTLSPFTKKPYHAANGFDALYMLALEMQSISECKFQLVKKDHNSVLVSLIFMRKCLNLHTVQLGFISDTNISNLEELGDVDQVDVTDYINTPHDVRSGVLHGQKGSFYSQDGTQWKVDDVWFRK
ncbi:hypothetical protein MIR68_004053 [Amoeboaphelidium protococcarum]|nr:hypothetical protein MIR68_004053 [Amoeboaphelidium protococcarum]